MITITETLYKKMPDDIKACFNQLPNPSSDEVRECFPETKSGNLNSGHKRGDGTGNSFMGGGGVVEGNYGGDSGSAARFFYCAKASKSERNRGCEELGGNKHCTVKPIALMEYLVKMVSREGQVVLDPFMGSGTTGMACKKLNREFIGIEKESDYCKIAEARIGAVQSVQEELL